MANHEAGFVRILLQEYRKSIVGKVAEESQLTPKELLEDLESEAVRCGMEMVELNEIRRIGNCRSQIQTRIGRLRTFIFNHQEAQFRQFLCGTTKPV